MSRAEKFISDCTRTCSNELVAVESRAGKEVISYHDWLTPDQARTAVEIEREEIYEWLQKVSFDDYKVADEESYRMGFPYDYIDVHRLISNLKQAIRNET